MTEGPSKLTEALAVIREVQDFTGEDYTQIIYAIETLLRVVSKNPLDPHDESELIRWHRHNRTQEQPCLRLIPSPSPRSPK